MPDDHAGDCQCLEDVDGAGLDRHPGHVVITHQQQRRHLIRQPLDALGKLALLRRIGLAILERVPGEDRQVGLMRQGVVDDFVQAFEKVADPARGAGDRIQSAVVLHADVQIGEVQQADGIGHAVPAVPPSRSIQRSRPCGGA